MRRRRPSATTAQNQVFAYAGSTKIYFGTPVKKPYYNDFDGHLRLKRVGTVWTFETAMTKNGRDYRRARKSMSIPAASAQIAIVELAIASHSGNATLPAQYISHVNMWRINDTTAAVQETILNDEDEIEIDMGRASVSINGKSHLSVVDPASEFFSIPAGGGTVRIESDGDFDTLEAALTLTKRWL